MVLKSTTIDNYVNEQKLNTHDKKILQAVADRTWFRQYAKRSKENLEKITDKVKKGIKMGKYSYVGNQVDMDEKQQWEMPKPKKKATGKKKTTSKKKATGKKKTTGKKKVSYAERKQKLTERKKKEFAPSGRQYSETELREGKGSRRARKWRIKHGIPEGDFYNKEVIV